MTNTQTVQAPKHLFSIKDYKQLVEIGLLQESDRVELLYGEIIKMSPIGPKHAGILDRMVQILTLLLGKSAIVRPQNPIQLSEYSEPEPDIAILKPREDYYTQQHPQAKDILLLIELAESSLDYDKTVKGPLYASSGIEEYWIIDLKENQVIVYTKPDGGSYVDVKTYRKNDAISSLYFPKPLVVSELLGKP